MSAFKSVCRYVPVVASRTTSVTPFPGAVARGFGMGLFPSQTAVAAPALAAQGRGFASKPMVIGSVASENLLEILRKEEKLENEELINKKDSFLEEFVKGNNWTVTDGPGSNLIVMSREVKTEVDGKPVQLAVTVDFEMRSLYDDDDEDEEIEGEESFDTGDQMFQFKVTAEHVNNGSGVVIFCTSDPEAEKGYNPLGVSVFENANEKKEALQPQRGFEVENFPESTQQALKEWTNDILKSSTDLKKDESEDDIVGFVREMAVNKEAREYIRMLSTFSKILTA